MRRCWHDHWEIPQNSHSAFTGEERDSSCGLCEWGEWSNSSAGALPSLSEGAVAAQEWNHSSWFHGAARGFLALSFRSSSVPDDSVEYQRCCHQMCPVPKPWQPAVPRAFPGTSQGRGKVENEEKGRSPTTNQPFSWALPLKS